MRISYWSSDVCSSDLRPGAGSMDPLDRLAALRRIFFVPGEDLGGRSLAVVRHAPPYVENVRVLLNGVMVVTAHENGRASCRERVCQYVSMSVGYVSLKTTQYLCD